MLFNGINEFESTFKTFDRLNAVVFNVWRDKSASAYRDGDIARISNEYRRYISKVRSLSEEANRLERELENKLRELDVINNQLLNISLNPEINGCSIYEAWGENTYTGEDGTPKTQRSESVRFVAKGSLESKARELIGESYSHISVSGTSKSL